MKNGVQIREKDDGGIESLRAWVIVIAHGQTLIGRADWEDYEAAKPTRPLLRLAPVLNLAVQVVQDGSGRVGVQRGCSPVLMLTSVTHIDVPNEAILIRLPDLSRPEQVELGRAIAQGEELIRNMRAGASGLTLAKTLPKDGGIIQ